MFRVFFWVFGFCLETSEMSSVNWAIIDSEKKTSMMEKRFTHSLKKYFQKCSYQTLFHMFGRVTF